MSNKLVFRGFQILVSSCLLALLFSFASVIHMVTSDIFFSVSVPVLIACSTLGIWYDVNQHRRVVSASTTVMPIKNKHDQKIGYIYGLYDKEERKIFYVGMTTGTPKIRLSSHLHGRERSNTPKNLRLRQMMKNKNRPIPFTLEKVENGNLRQRELHWIDHFGLDNLTNSHR